jgi:hypothetical protein
MFAILCLYKKPLHVFSFSPNIIACLSHLASPILRLFEHSAVSHGYVSSCLFLWVPWRIYGMVTKTVSNVHSSYLTPGRRVVLAKPAQPLKKFPSFYGTWKFITELKRTQHFPSPKPDELSPPFLLLTWRSILVLFFHLCLVLPYGLISSRFPTQSTILALLAFRRLRTNFCGWPTVTEAKRSLVRILIRRQPVV